MEIERSPAMSAKKLWNMFRIVLLMLRKELSKSRMIISDVHLMMKRGKLAGKAILNLMQIHHSSGFSCRTATDIAHSIAISPQDYEFSCSNSPAAFPALQFIGKRHKHHNFLAKSYKDAFAIDNAVKRAIEMLNSDAVEASPAVALPEFGRSPAPVRKLRVTDSPFPLPEGGDGKVDEAAEAFIRRFYSNLRQQKALTALDSPSPYHDGWGR